MRVLIIGCGYVGLPLGAELVSLGHSVAGLRRTGAADEDLRAAGILPVHADIADAAALQALEPAYDWVVNCAAASDSSVAAYERLYYAGTQNIIRWLAKSPVRKYVYTSSTGVYAQDDGSWVDEDDPAEASSDTGRVLVRAERLLFTASEEQHFPAVVLRVAGIYGPERGFYYRQLLSGQARIQGDGTRYVNMIHRNDVAGAIIAALTSGLPGQACNVCDNEPVMQKDLYAWLAQELNLPLPPRSTEGSTRSGRTVTNKRISNHRLTREWGYRLRYPTFREGYRTLLAPK